MAITPNIFTTQNTPNFVGYTPATEGLNITSVLFDALDMVSVNQVASAPIQISYFVGAASEYVWALNIKNIALGSVVPTVPLDVTVSCNTELFTVNDKNEATVTLPSSGATAQFIIRLNKLYANSAPLQQALRSIIKIEVTSPNVSGYVYTNNQVSLLDRNELPTIVTIN